MTMRVPAGQYFTALEIKFEKNIGDKVTSRFFHALHFGQIVQKNYSAARKHRCNRGFVSASRNDSRASDMDLPGVDGLPDSEEQIGFANRLNERRVQSHAVRHEAVHGSVHPLHAFLAIY